MKRIISLALILSTLLIFTQKTFAYVPLLETGMRVNCSMLNVSTECLNDKGKADCSRDDTSHNTDCQFSCDLMMVASLFNSTEHIYVVTRHELQLTYQAYPTGIPYYLPDILYRPPLIS